MNDADKPASSQQPTPDESDPAEWPVFGALARACALSWGDERWTEALSARAYADLVLIVHKDRTTFTRKRAADEPV